jgi:hypothetical protein
VDDVDVGDDVDARPHGGVSGRYEYSTDRSTAPVGGHNNSTIMWGKGIYTYTPLGT